MDNIKLLLNLNNDTKKYMDDTLSFIDYFNERKNLTPEEVYSYSFLLSTLMNDKDLALIFNNNNLIVDKLFEYLNINENDVRYKSSEDSKYIENNDITTIFSNIAQRIKYNNNFQDNLLLCDLKPYQIFYEVIENYFNQLKDLCNKIDVDFEKILINELYKEINKLDVNFKKEINNTENTNLGVIKFVFKDNNCYLVLDDSYVEKDIIMDGLYSNKKDKIKSKDKADVYDFLLSNHLYKITSICGYRGKELNKQKIFDVIDRLDVLDAFTVKLVDPEDKDKSFNVTFDSVKILNTDNKKDVTLSEIFDTHEEKTTSMTPNLDKYGFDLTKETYVKDPSVGRDEKLRELEKILLYPERDKSIIVTGEAGCGKTALVRGLAYRVQKGDVPENLKNLRIYSIDVTTLVAGTKYAGTLEEKMTSIFNDASSSKDILIFMDEIHRTLGAGKTDGDDNSISEMLKPYLDSGRIRVIGATTTDDYNEYLLEDDAFRTRFKRVKLDEPTKDIIYDVVDDLITSYNKFNYSKLLVSDEERANIINYLMDATDKSHRNYNDGASNPRLILDIVKDAYAVAALDDRTEVTTDDIANALLGEEKIYKSARENYAKKIRSNNPEKKLCKVINFKDYIK